MTVNFSLLALDQIMNNAATLLHMSGGQFNVPLVIRMTTGAGRQLAAQHSHSLEGWYAHIPGLRVLAPATLEDARGMLWTALAGPRPGADLRARLALQHRRASSPTTPAPVDIDRAAVRRAGSDVTLDHLRRHAAARRWTPPSSWPPSGIDAEVHRPAHAAPAGRRRRSSASVRRTHRAVVVDEGWRTRQPRRRGQRPDHRAGVLRPRRAGRAGLQRRGADALRRGTWRRPRCPGRRAIVAAARRAVG